MDEKLKELQNSKFITDNGLGYPDFSETTYAHTEISKISLKDNVLEVFLHVVVRIAILFSMFIAVLWGFTGIRKINFSIC